MTQFLLSSIHNVKSPITKRAAKITSADNPSDDLINVLSQYATGNPFINTLLFERIKKKDPPSIDLNDLEECIEDFIVRARLNAGNIPLLKQLATQLPVEWTARDLKQVTPSINVEDTGMKRLFTAGIVQQLKDTPYYQMDEGLHALIKRAAVLEANDD